MKLVVKKNAPAPAPVVANTKLVANKADLVANKEGLVANRPSKHGVYADKTKRRAYMREYMKAKREKERGE